jgi:hypothetical protein
VCCATSGIYASRCFCGVMQSWIFRFAYECAHMQVLYAARRGFYFVLPKPGTQQPKGKDGEQGVPAGVLQAICC